MLTLEKTMTFLGGRATFVSAYKEHVTWPIGPPSTIVVDNRVVTKPASYAQFENHRWSTNKPDYAQGMIAMEHFGDRDGWSLDVACLPEVFVELWGAFTVATKRKIGLALCAGDDPEKVFNGLLDSDLDAPRKSFKVGDVAEPEFVCPVPECGLRTPAGTDPLKAKVAIMEHVRLSHPEWEE